MEVHYLEALARVTLELLIRAEGEEAGRLVPVVFGEPFFLLAAGSLSVRSRSAAPRSYA
jgi:hypothetical protein